MKSSENKLITPIEWVKKIRLDVQLVKLKKKKKSLYGIKIIYIQKYTTFPFNLR